MPPSTDFAIDPVELLDLIHAEARANLRNDPDSGVERGECP
jgi:hypothetical protein